jgi:hypothetical protein
MALKSLKVKVSEQPATKKTDGPRIIPCEGVTVTEFNSLKAQIAELEARKDALEVELKQFGTTEIIKINCENAGNPVSSVKLKDDNDTMAVVSFVNKYSVIDGAAVSAMFDEINVRRKLARKPLATAGEEIPQTLMELDVNDFAQFLAEMKINSEVFFDKDGTFLEDVYATVRKAIDKVTAELVAKGKIAADTKIISEKQLAKVKPNFHETRWALGVSDNTTLTAVVKNTISLKAVVA